MSVEGLNAVLKKEEVVVTKQARDFIERPQLVDDDYRWHVSTYIPMHKGVAAEGQLDVAAFARRLMQRVRERKPALGYLTADFGYGKTSAGLYLWKQSSEAGFITVPPFQLNRLPDLLDATYGWVRYSLSRKKPNFVVDAEQIYNRYANQSLAEMIAQSGASDEVLKQWISSGMLSLDLPPESLSRFFREMTELIEYAGFNGLMVLPDEIQQYLEPRIKSGLADPISPLFNLVQMLASLNDMPFGLLLIIPQKELNVINDQRSDFIDRIRSLTLDLRAVYGREFPVQLWSKLAKVFNFEPFVEHIFQPETLEALGQISIRDDLSNGPRTVINTFRAVISRHLKHNLARPYSPIDLIDDFLKGVIIFDGTKRIQDSVGQALASNLVRNNPGLIPAVKLAAAFPVEGCSSDLQRRYELKDAFDELITSGLNELVIGVGDRREGGVTLHGLEVMRDESNWLTKTIREFHRNYYVEASNTLERTVRGFIAVLRHNIFKGSEWKLQYEATANDLQNSGLVLEGTFSSIARRFPNRVVYVRVLSEDEPVKDASTYGEVTLEFRLKRHFDVIVGQHGKAVLQTITLDEKQYSAYFSLNLLYQSDLLLPHRLEMTLGKVVPESKITPLFLLALHDYLEKLRSNQRIPKTEAQLVEYEFQPELRRVALDELLNLTVGAQFGSVGARVVEDVVAYLLKARYGTNYHTLMVVANWNNNLRKYNAALRQLKTSFERQGFTPVRADKDQIASLFGLANTGLDNYLANMDLLLELVDKFPSKHNSKVGTKGSIRFKQHPLEIQIQSWITNSTDTVQKDDRPYPAMLLTEIKNRASTLGYKEIETEHIITLLEIRELARSQAGYLTLFPPVSFSLEEVAERIEQFQHQTKLLQQLFPQAVGLSKLNEKSSFFVEQIRLLPLQSDETVFNLLVDLNEQNDWLTETKHSCLSGLWRQINAQERRLPRLTERGKTLLEEQITGSGGYLSQLNNIRLNLLQTYQQLVDDHRILAQSLSQVPAIDEISAMEDVQLIQLVQITEQREQTLTRVQERIHRFENEITQFKSWVDASRQNVALLNQLQQSGTLGKELLQQLRAAEATVVFAFTQQSTEQLSGAKHYQEQLAEIKRQLSELEVQASSNFANWQSAYQKALMQQFDIPLTNMWAPVIYSPLNPEGVRTQVYEAVQRTILDVLAVLDRETRKLTNSLRGVATSPALQFLNAVTRNQVVEQTTQLTMQLENLYDLRELEEYASDLSLIENFQPTTGGNFYALLEQIAAARQTLQDYKHQFDRLQAPLQRLDLSTIETEIMTFLAQLNQHPADLIEVREKFAHLKDDVFWDAIRTLWAKQLIYLQVESKLTPAA